MRWLIGPERDLVKGLGLMAHRSRFSFGSLHFCWNPDGWLVPRRQKVSALALIF
jgi:hypothetical protein